MLGFQRARVHSPPPAAERPSGFAKPCRLGCLPRSERPEFSNQSNLQTINTSCPCKEMKKKNRINRNMHKISPDPSKSGQSECSLSVTPHPLVDGLPNKDTPPVLGNFLQLLIAGFRIRDPCPRTLNSGVCGHSLSISEVTQMSQGSMRWYFVCDSGTLFTLQ